MNVKVSIENRDEMMRQEVVRCDAVGGKTSGRNACAFINELNGDRLCCHCFTLTELQPRMTGGE